MCGILGILNIENKVPIDRSLLETMSSAMSHRGPDGSGVWLQEDGQCGLAHRRLSIVDLSERGHQPMATPDGSVWLTFNGEIYNFPEMRRAMEAKGFSFRSDSDTEVILYLYKEYGERFFEMLDGDFAIGLWDRGRKRLFLVRDRAGVKPLYYAHVDGRLIFASEMKALLKYPSISREIDQEALYHYLTFLVVPPPRTLVKGICKLEAATCFTLDPEKGYGPRIEKYWLPLPKVEHGRSFESFDEELEALFSSSVRKRLQSDVPVGVLFSGGVDSTLNLGSFSRLVAPEKVRTFTVGMDNAAGLHDDSAVAREMAKRMGSDHHEIRISERDLIATAQKLAYLQDEPVSDPVAVPLYFVTKLAKECGVTVLQAGEGADELFCGYANYRRFIKHHDTLWRPLSRLPRWISAAGSAIMAGTSDPRGRKIRDVLARQAAGQEFFMSSAVAYYELEKQRILSPAMRAGMAKMDSFDVIRPYYDRLHKERPDATFLQKMTFIELQLRLPELLLMRADKMAMANAVEIRVPFLDQDLMDFSMRVPDAYKLRDGISKEPVKRLALQFASRDEIFRPKTGFGVPVQHWFKGELGTSLLERLDADNSGIVKSLLDVDAVRHHLRYGLRTVNEGFQLWVIYNLLVWREGLAQ